MGGGEKRGRGHERYTTLETRKVHKGTSQHRFLAKLEILDTISYDK